MKCIQNGSIYWKGKFYDKKVLVYDENIKKIIDKNEADHFLKEADEIIDAKGLKVVPGFIDVHIHGYLGADVMDGNKESLEKIRKGIASNGVTSFLPTTMTQDKNLIIKALENIREAMDVTVGANVIGAHLEGPYINPKYKGAQPEKYIRLPEDDLLNEFSDIIKVVTIAPEMDGAIDIIERYSDKFCFSLGHTAADYYTAKKAFEKGAKSVTHLFNAMTPLHHRNPGVAGAALTSDNYAELIADTIHVHPDLFSMILRLKSNRKVILITDCMEAGGLEDGQYRLGGLDVTVKNNKCTLEDGTIAGSTLRLCDGLKNMKEHTELPLEELLPLATLNQATYLGMESNIGSIDEGKQSDFVFLDDTLTVQRTIVKGTSVYEKDNQ